MCFRLHLRRWCVLLSVAVLSFSLAVGCSASFQPFQSFQAFQPKDTSPVVMGYSSWPGWWPWAIADAEGLFEANGANVDLRWFDNYTESLEALANGEIDANCQTLSDTLSFATNAVNGEVAILVNDNSEGNDKIIVDESIPNLWNLQRKRVAVEAGVVDDFLLSLALESVGLRRNDVQIVNMDTESAAKAFAAGQVDAVGAFPPFWDIALQRPGSYELISSEAFPGAIPDLLVVSQAIVDQRPDQALALIHTWFDVLQFMAQNPERADQILAERAGVSIADLRKFEEGTRIFSLADNREAFTPGQDMKHLDFAARKTSEFLVQHLVQGAIASPGQVLDSQFIAAYAEDRVS